MSYTYGTILPLATGEYISASEVAGHPGPGETSTNLVVQFYDAALHPTHSQIIANRFFDGLTGSRSSFTDVDLVATSTGGFALSFTYTSQGGYGFASSTSQRVYLFDHDGTTLGSVSLSGSAPSLTALGSGEVAVLQGSHLTFLASNASVTSALDLPRAPGTVQDGYDAVLLTWSDPSGTTVQAVHANGVIDAATTLQTITGTAASDVLLGGGGSDSIVAGAGDDLLFGGPGYDTLSGGAGADKFVFQLGSVDRVTDFNPASDYFLIFNQSGQIAADARSVLTFNAQNHVVTWDADGDPGAGAPVAVAVLDGVSHLDRSDLAAGFQPAVFRMINADGSHSDVTYGWDGSYVSASADYDSAGTLQTYTVNLNGGSHWTKWFDTNDAQTWDNLYAEWDAAGRLSTYATTMDDGSHVIRTFDVAGVQPYDRLVDEYDGAGHLLARSVVLDNGAYWVATFDVSNNLPWGYSVDSFDAAGRLVGHSLYNDDGSAFVG